MSHAAGALRRAAAPALLFLFGAAVCLYYGRRGYMPLDQSICFDGGWRMLSGQVPFRDYHAPNGFVVHALQAVWFGLFGVSWLVYCSHAAVVNGLFALLVAWLLARLGLARGWARTWGALSALVLYPPFGVPYMDQHAFFFSFLAVALAAVARRDEGRGRARPLVWLALPSVLLLAGLSKQVPSAFVIPIVLAAALVDRRARALARLGRLALGAAAPIALLAAAGAALGVDLDRVDRYFLTLPAEEGSLRWALLPGLGPLLERMRYTGEGLGLQTIPLLHAAAFLGLAGSVGLALARGERMRERWRRPLPPAFLAWALLLVCLLFVAFTSNQPELGVPLLFVAAGLVHLALERARDSLLAARLPWPALAARALGVALVAVGLADGWRFTGTVNATRVVNDLEWDPEAAGLATPRVHPKLAFMRWQLPPGVAYAPEDLRDLADFLGHRGEPFLLLSDASVLYGLTGQPSVAPSLWYQHGLTFPRPEPDFSGWAVEVADYEDLLLARLEEHECRFVVLEHPCTWARVELDWFPRLAARVEGRRVASQRFGPFEAIELAP